MLVRIQHDHRKGQHISRVRVGERVRVASSIPFRELEDQTVDFLRFAR